MEMEMHQSDYQQFTKFSPKDLEIAKNVLLNPNLKPVLAEATTDSKDCDIFFRDSTSEHDIRSSECISIEFDHLEKISQCSAFSLKDYQIYDDSGGSTSSDDPCIIKMKLIPDCAQSVSTKICTNYEKSTYQGDPVPSIYEDALCPSEITLNLNNQCSVDEEPTKFVMPMPKKKKSENRYDTLYRSLLRKMRKWYQSSFRKNTDYEQRKKSYKLVFLEVLGDFCNIFLKQPSNKNLVFTLANLINPRLIQKNKASFCKEYSTLSTFLKDMATRNGSGKSVFENFSFIKMEKTICTKEYDILLRFFIDNCDTTFTEDERYALQQMLKVSSYHDQHGMNSFS
ncbi:unnamed protein product [Moneuplotes crassus]|uniref:Uncharacterized protein n=1 Tax=Euplotes crassus TaxID=5936 RepID=A0AAD1X8D3_EUPCR|nr:unnamed protein product [Moneuplotes crassus]